jgi:hypothetical protein
LVTNLTKANQVSKEKIKKVQKKSKTGSIHKALFKKMLKNTKCLQVVPRKSLEGQKCNLKVQNQPISILLVLKKKK